MTGKSEAQDREPFRTIYCPGCVQLTLRIRVLSGSCVGIQCQDSPLMYEPGLGYDVCEWGISWVDWMDDYRPLVEIMAPKMLKWRSVIDELDTGSHEECADPASHRKGNAERSRADVEMAARKAWDRVREIPWRSSRQVSGPDENAGGRVMPSTDYISIGGNVISIDKETARAILLNLRVTEDESGEYAARIRKVPLVPVASNNINMTPAGDTKSSSGTFPGRAVPSPGSVRDSCDICSLPEQGRSLAVDHDHRTGALRGYLCGRCNPALGMFRDSPELLRRAADYLESPPGISVDRWIPSVKDSRVALPFH